MKKIIAFLSLAVAVMACTNEPKEVKKEIIVAPVTPPPPPPKTIIVKDSPEKATTIKVDKTGVDVETKKVGVSIKP